MQSCWWTLRWKISAFLLLFNALCTTKLQLCRRMGLKTGKIHISLDVLWHVDLLPRGVRQSAVWDFDNSLFSIHASVSPSPTHVICILHCSIFRRPNIPDFTKLNVAKFRQINSKWALKYNLRYEILVFYQSDYISETMTPQKRK